MSYLRHFIHGALPIGCLRDWAAIRGGTAVIYSSGMNRSGLCECARLAGDVC